MNNFSRLLWAAGILTAVAILATFLGAAESHSGIDRFLVTVPNPAGLPGEAGASGPFRIAITTAGDPAPQMLTSLMWTASSPSIGFDGQRFLFSGRKLATDKDGIWEMEISGSGLQLITQGNGAPASPAYLPNGRIIYSDVPASVKDSSLFPRAIYSCAPDGSDRKRLTFGNHRDERPSLLADGRVLFKRVFNESSFGYESLQMTIHPDGAGFARFNGVAVLASPAEPVSLARQDHSGSRQTESRLTGSRQTGSTLQQDVVKVISRHRPPVLTSVLKASVSTGTLLCLNVYTSRLAAIRDLLPGTISAVRISVLAPSTQGRRVDTPVAHGPVGDDAIGRLAVTRDSKGIPIGTAPVFADGSFQVVVPADVPLQLTLLENDGTVAATLASGIWVRPNETRGCIGCHENPNLAPTNRRPMAVTQPVTRLTWESGSAEPVPARGGAE